jgi:hypothetical protein
MNKHLAKKLITDAVNKFYKERVTLYCEADIKQVIQHMYGEYLVGKISIEDIREEIKKAFDQPFNY